MQSFEVIEGANSRVFVFCDHASNRVPPELDGLGLPEAELARHIAWDIGAEAVTRALCARFGCTGLVAGVSRLVVDLNREPGADGFIAETSDGTVVPGNRDLSPSARAKREAIHAAYHDTLSDLLDARPDAFAVSVHSFTPEPRGGARRTLDLGLLAKHNEDDGDWTSAESFLAALPAEWETAINAPYSAYDLNYTVDRHVIPRGLRHLGIEVRQDHIETEAGAHAFARHIGDALESVLAATR